MAYSAINEVEMVSVRNREWGKRIAKRLLPMQPETEIRIVFVNLPSRRNLKWTFCRRIM